MSNLYSFSSLTDSLGRTLRLLLVLTFASLSVVSLASFSAAQCPEEPPLQNYTGSGTVVCPCFVAGEEAGAVLQAPVDHYPIEILRVGIGWGSQFGGAPQSLESYIHVYDGSLPNPGTPISSLAGPVLNDGFINEFDLEPLPGDIIINSGPFTVTLEFLNANSGDPFAPSMVHDGNGCQATKNVVYAIPGGWYDACVLGVTGDWVVYAIYRQTDCGAGIDEELIVTGNGAVLTRPQPNPFSSETRLEFVLANEELVDLTVYDVRGQAVANLAGGAFSPGRHSSVWSGTSVDGSPASPGIYFATLTAGGRRTTQRLVLSK
jgi:hypothetical protein